jgi:hypothetical protein
MAQRRCYKGRLVLLQGVTGVATLAWRRCYKQRRCYRRVRCCYRVQRHCCLGERRSYFTGDVAVGSSDDRRGRRMGMRGTGIRSCISSPAALSAVFSGEGRGKLSDGALGGVLRRRPRQSLRWRPRRGSPAKAVTSSPAAPSTGFSDARGKCSRGHCG